MIARAAATLSELCGGRFILGIGAGNRKELIDLLALPSDHAGARCREAVVTARRLLAGETVSHASPTLTLKGVKLDMTPPPRTPVYLAARGPQILKAAGEVADGVIIGALVSEAGLGFALEHVRAGARQADRALEHVEIVSWVTTVVTDHKPEIVQGLRPMVAHVVGGAPPEVLDAIGMTQARIKEFKSVYAEGGPSGAARLVDPSLVDLLTIVGGPGEVADRITALAGVGVGQVAVLMPGPGRGSHAFPGFDHRANLERIAHEVRPRVKAA
jgi:5,10-methylenetetrahydromethanopterin reductase